MAEKDVFNNKTWNFLQGDRQVEGIIRDLPPTATLVVRNQLPNVLATVAGLLDMAAIGWVEDAFSGRMKVPENALVFRASEQGTPAEMFQRWLLPLYGVQQMEKGIPGGRRELLLVLNATASFAQKAEPTVMAALVQEIRQRQPETVVFIVPPGEKLHPDLRRYLKDSWTSLYFGGFNAMSVASLEEAVAEFAPDSIAVAGYSAQHVFYTAIGAVDYFITEDAAFRNPATLSLPDLHDLGRKVTVLKAATDWGEGKAAPFREHLVWHLQQCLQVSDTGGDPRFMATSESIAIDIV